MSAGEADDFTTELVGGENAGEQADVTVTVTASRRRSCPSSTTSSPSWPASSTPSTSCGPGPASSSAESGSSQVAPGPRQGPGRAARPVDIPLPERVVKAEIERREHNLETSCEQAAQPGRPTSAQGKTEEELDERVRRERAGLVKAGFVLDKLAEAEELGVDAAGADTSSSSRRHRMGVSPDQLAQQISRERPAQQRGRDVLRTRPCPVADAPGHRRVREPGRPHGHLHRGNGATGEDEDDGAAEDDVADAIDRRGRRPGRRRRRLVRRQRTAALSADLPAPPTELGVDGHDRRPRRVQSTGRASDHGSP